ncbi:MAG: heme peroxidase family protein, partial [Chloroflexota bacterium]|nr:heme peroxidase family protein [Chloroflexota bacterium]
MTTTPEKTAQPGVADPKTLLEQAPVSGGPMHGLMPPRDGSLTPLGITAPTGKFGRIFGALPALEPDDGALEELGAAMFEADGADPALDNPNVPAGYTYLGQFIDHDITLDTSSLQEIQVDPLALRNFRTAALDLDSLYGQGPGANPELYTRVDPDLFELGNTGADNSGAGDSSIRQSHFDLPRTPSGLAIIADPRNDENLIVAQLHRTFLQFHNAVVSGIRGGQIQQVTPGSLSPFDEARQIVTWHYQWVVLHDFLRRVLDTAVLDDVVTNGPKFMVLAHNQEMFIPVEFSAAAYRLGHSMIRASYNYNRVFTFLPGGLPIATLRFLFLFSGRSGTANGTPIPPDWVIDWRRFVDLGTGNQVNAARQFDPFLAGPLAGAGQPNPELSGIPNVPAPSSLPIRNLKRGRSFGLPSGQAIARFMGQRVLTPDEVAQGPDGAIAAKHGLHIESPLWYYILKEAQVLGNSAHLGPVGSRIVAETFVAMLQADNGSFLTSNPSWKPTLGATVGTFELADLIKFAVANDGGPNPIGEVPQPLVDANPNIVQQLLDWRQQRRQNGQDPFDFAAFRQHLLDLGAPDVGDAVFMG